MINNTNENEKKRREVWIALLGAIFLGSFLIFGGCQAQIFPGLNAAAQGSLFPVATATVPATAAPEPTVTTVIIPTATAASVAPTVPVPVHEAPLVVPFASREGVTSTQSYSGPTSVTVSGSGQAQGKQFSDAFYLYTDAKGKAIPPVHPKVNGLLCVDSKPIDSYVLTIPAYNPTHVYPLSLNAPGGHLKFGVCDVPQNFGDNTNSFTIAFD